MKQILTKVKSQTVQVQVVAPGLTEKTAASSLCLLHHTTQGAAYRPTLRVSDFEAGVMGPQLF